MGILRLFILSTMKALILLTALFPWSCGLAQGLPEWEAGVGIAGLHLPYYRGAEQEKTYLLPMPYVTYRGTRLKIDDAGIYSHLFTTDRIRLDLSISGGIPVPKDGAGVREGMPSLAPTLEVGPSLELQLWEHPHKQHEAWLRLPLRAAISVDWPELAHQGWVFAPYVEYVLSKHVNRDWRKDTVSIGPIFADSAYHDYFYTVAPVYATAQRPTYHARAGYSGSRITLTMQRRVGKIWAGAFVRFDTLSGAVMEDSPLVSTRQYYALGFGITRIIAESRKTAETDLHK